MRNDKDNLIVRLSFEFALEIIKYTEKLEDKKKYVLAKQLLKSSTSIGANIREAQNAKSKADFIHKLKISAKEADESEYWLLLCQKSENYPDPKDLLTKVSEIIRILSKIISTSKQKTNLKIFKLSNYQILKSVNYQINPSSNCQII